MERMWRPDGKAVKFVLWMRAMAIPPPLLTTPGMDAGHCSRDSHNLLMRVRYDGNSEADNHKTLWGPTKQPERPVA